MFFPLQKFDQRPFDVVIPLVPGFEREVFKAPFRFPFRHLSGDNSAATFEREVLKGSESGFLWKNRPICG